MTAFSSNGARSAGATDDTLVQSLARWGGAGVTFVAGPAAAYTALAVLGMGMLEAASVFILVSGWLGPKLMHIERA